MRKFLLSMALLLCSIGAMAQDATERILGVNNIPSTRVDLSQGLESGYYLLRQTNNNSSAAGGQGVGWIKAASETDNAVVTSKNTGTPGENGATYIWYVEVVDAEKKLITISTANKVAAWQAPTTHQKNLVAYDSRATLKYHTGTVNIDRDATPNEGSCFISNEGMTAFVHFSGDNLGSWTDTNSASMFMVEFYKLGDSDLNKGFEATITYNVTDNAGNEFTGTYKGILENTKPTFTGANGYTLTNEVWDGTHYTATINFTYPMSNKDNGITNEVLLAQFGNKYWHAVGTEIKVQTTGVAKIDANCLWAIYPSFNESAFTFEIMNIATGKYIYTVATNAAHNTESTIVLNDTPTEFVINSDKDFKVKDKNLFISINSTNDTDVYLGLYGNPHNGTDVTSSELPQYEVTITDAKYATFYAPYAVNVPEGVTAHAVTINGEWATLGDALETIPAYTGVVLYSETANTYTFTVTTTDAVVESELRGTVATTYVEEDAYVLANKENVVGFYVATKNQLENTAFLNNHHKAYLPKPAGAANVACYSFRFDGTTGIENVEGQSEGTAIYDLMGRRVENPTRGIYVINGKKVLVK